MTKREREYKAALTKFKRTAGQLKRYADIDPESYLIGKNTAKGIEKALKQMQIDYDQQRIDERLQQYEEKRYERYRQTLEKEMRKQSQQAEKNKDLADKLNQYQTGYETFKENFDYDLSETDFRELIDVWGGISEEIKEAYGGSDPDMQGYGNLVYGYKEIKDPLLKQEYPQMLKDIRETMPSATQEELMNEVYRRIEEKNREYEEMEEKKGRRV